MFETNEILKQYNKSVMNLGLIFIFLITVGEIIVVNYMKHSGVLTTTFGLKMVNKLVPVVIDIVVFIIGHFLLRRKDLTIVQKSIIPIGVVTFICLCFLVCNHRTPLCILALILPILLAVLNAEAEVEVTNKNAVICTLLTLLVAAILFFLHYDLGYDYIMNLIVAVEFLVALILICTVLVKLERKRNDMLTASVKERDYYHNKSIIDALTKSYNRASYTDTLNNNFDKYENIALAVIDIDKFKVINDTYGHANGDVVLKYLAKMLNNTNSEEVFVARYGGEEFVILFFNKDVDYAYKVIDKLKNKFTNIKFKELNNNNVTFSCGISTKNKKTTQESLFEKADKALYEAKEKGRNRIIIAK